MIEREIPSTGTKFPVIGLGTWKAFDVGVDPKARARLTGVVDNLFSDGGTVIDSSPMYGAAEGVVGDILATTGKRNRAFVATKVWTEGESQGLASILRSMQFMHADPIDLVQVHNLVDWRIHLKTLRRLKDEGRVGHIGITHYRPSAHDDLMAVMTSEAIDTVQVDYSVEDRAAEDRLLPLARDRGIAVIVNVPLGAGSLVRRLAGRPLPAVAGDLDCRSWPELLLKFVVSHPAVTVAIPGTGNPDHMRANMRAGANPLPDAAQREEIARAAA